MADGDVSTGANGQPHEYLSIDCTSASFTPDASRCVDRSPPVEGGRCAATRPLRLTFLLLFFLPLRILASLTPFSSLLRVIPLTSLFCPDTTATDTSRRF